jgi:hypothetical protein
MTDDIRGQEKKSECWLLFTNRNLNTNTASAYMSRLAFLGRFAVSKISDGDMRVVRLSFDRLPQLLIPKSEQQWHRGIER